MRRLNAIEDESATGGSRPGAGAAPEPEPRPPQPSQSKTKPAESFRPVGRGLTQRRARPRRIQTTKNVGSDVRIQWATLRTAATGLPAQPGSGLNSKPPQTNGVDSSSFSLPPQVGSIGQDKIQAVQNEEANSGIAGVDLGDASALPDISGVYQGEMAALLAFYAARIGAARRSVLAGDVAAVVQALMNEQTVAVRALMERWQAATKKHREEKPQRPTGIASRKDKGPTF